jgi:hypothetical protein
VEYTAGLKDLVRQRYVDSDIPFSSRYSPSYFSSLPYTQSIQACPEIRHLIFYCFLYTPQPRHQRLSKVSTVSSDIPSVAGAHASEAHRYASVDQAGDISWRQTQQKVYCKRHPSGFCCYLTASFVICSVQASRVGGYHWFATIFLFDLRTKVTLSLL